MKKSIQILLSLILCCTFIAGCGTQSGEPTYYDPVYDNKPVESTDKLTLSKDGNTEYKIVIPENAEHILSYAAEELKLYFDDATGANIVIVNDKELTYSDSAKYISLGETTFMAGTNYTLNDVPKRDGKTIRDAYIIKTVGNSYIICGGEDYGTLYGVYEFLHQAFGWEAYSASEIYYERVSEALVEKLDIVDEPAFLNRTGGYYEGRDDVYLTAKLRTYANYGIGIDGEDLWGLWLHSHFKIMRNGYPESTHPQYYGNKQLCLTADGIVEDFSTSVVDFILENPEQIYFMMGHSDNSSYCACANCHAYDVMYDGEDDSVEHRGRSVLMMEFFNDVCQLVNQKLLAEESLGDLAARQKRVDEIRLITFAYLFTDEPPVEYNATTGEYTVMETNRLTVQEVSEGEDFSMKSEKYKIIKGEKTTMTCTEDNQIIMICPYAKSYDYYHSLVDEKYNPKTARIIRGWAKITDKFICYAYGNNFNMTFEWWDDFSSYAENAQYFYENSGGEWFFSENASSVKGSVSFQALRSYVYSKLQWNPYLNVDELIDDFMLHYYKVASPYVKEYYEFLRLYYNTRMHENEMNGDKGIQTTNFNWYGTSVNDYETLLQMGTILNNAVEAVKSSNYTEAEKVKLINRITLESMTVRYALIESFSSYYTTSTYRKLVDSFIEDCKVLEVFAHDDGSNSDLELESKRSLWYQKKGIVA